MTPDWENLRQFFSETKNKNIEKELFIWINRYGIL